MTPPACFVCARHHLCSATTKHSLEYARCRFVACENRIHAYNLPLRPV